MGASESKLGFKHAVFRLAEKKKIATNDPFWAEVCCTLHRSAPGVADLSRHC